MKRRWPGRYIILLVALVVLRLCTPSWPETLPSSVTKPPMQRNILILTAHPDDECMFFAPTVLRLVAQGHHIRALCLSNGDSEGLGSVREKELVASYGVLGVDASRVTVVDHMDLRDSMSSSWDLQLVGQIVRDHVGNTTDTILTFDAHGVSSHPNHIALFSGAKMLASQMPDITLLSLTTVPLPPKYMGILAPLYAHIRRHSPLFGSSSGLYVSGIADYWTALCAMRQHPSQLVWFRWLYVSFSRYMWVNDWMVVE